MSVDGPVLRAWRRQRGWDVPETARRLRAEAARLGQPIAEHDGLVRMIYKWERGATGISERYELLYEAAVLGRPDPQPEPERNRRGVPRRDFVLLAGTVTSLLDVLRTIPPAIGGRVASGARVDAETCAGLESMVTGYRQVYASAGAPALLDPVCGTLSLLTDLAPAAGQHREALVSLIGQTAAMAAVMLYLDAGNYEEAPRYMALAARAAQQADDRELLAVTMGVRAFHAAYGGDPADGLAFAAEADEIAARARVHPRTRGWVSAVRSEMHATLGDTDGCMRALDAANGALSSPMEGQWKGIGAFTSAKLTAYRGGAPQRLGRHKEAQETLTTALADLDPVQAKHRTTAHVDLADAYAADRQPDQAAAHASAALDIVNITRHAESLRRVTAIAEKIKPTKTQEARDLAGRLLETRAGFVS
jgi:tetratricopeptide (TPR) repeat protein